MGLQPTHMTLPWTLQHSVKWNLSHVTASPLSKNPSMRKSLFSDEWELQTVNFQDNAGKTNTWSRKKEKKGFIEKRCPSVFKLVSCRDSSWSCCCVWQFHCKQRNCLPSLPLRKSMWHNKPNSNFSRYQFTWGERSYCLWMGWLSE